VSYIKVPGPPRHEEGREKKYHRLSAPCIK
jgi:hypothetical protein